MIRTLVLTKVYPNRASYYDDWRDAFESSRIFRCDVFNILQPGASFRLAKFIGDYELVVLLHACTADSLHAIRLLAPSLNLRRGKLLSFIGNEINSPDSPLGDKIEFLKNVSADYIATQLTLEAGKWLYAECPGQVVTVPHALNSRAFHPNLPQRRRPIDIGVRNFRYLPHMGDQERNRIIEFFAKNTFRPPLRTDIKDQDRFNREGWNGFLNRCRGTVSSEAGTAYLERDDATVKAVRRYVVSKTKGIVLSGDSAARRMASYLPYKFKSYLLRRLRRGFITYGAVSDEEVDFNDVYQQFFAGRPKCPVHSKAISSRHFDAVGTKTVQLMFPGRYNDILRADEHYIALTEDFSNIDDVMQRFADLDYVQTMVNRTYEYVVAHHTHAHRLEDLYKALG